jgi:hypothetical protein
LMLSSIAICDCFALENQRKRKRKGRNPTKHFILK